MRLPARCSPPSEFRGWSGQEGVVEKHACASRGIDEIEYLRCEDFDFNNRGKTFFPQEALGAGTRAAENRFRACAGNSKRARPRSLLERRSDRSMESGQRRRHAPLSGRSWLAVEDRSRFARVNQPGPGAESRSPAQSRERDDHGSREAARCGASRCRAHSGNPIHACHAESGDSENACADRSIQATVRSPQSTKSRSDAIH